MLLDFNHRISQPAQPYVRDFGSETAASIRTGHFWSTSEKQGTKGTRNCTLPAPKKGKLSWVAQWLP